MTNNEITLHGNTLHLAGKIIAQGDLIPNFEVTDKDFNKISFYEFKKDKICLISSVPSLDTPVCQIQTKKFNQTLKESYADKIKACTISMDLPFAQSRFCESEKISEMPVFSDHIKHDFAQKCGLFIEELGLTARAVIVVNTDNTVKYIELVKEVSNEPNYENVLAQLQS